MAIDIKHVNTGTNNRITTPTGGKSGATSAPQTASNGGAATKSDSVSITSQAQQLQNVQSKLNDIPEVDSKK